MRVAIMFPGQGCQYVGMCRNLVKEFSEAVDIFEEANAALSFDIHSLILNGDIRELTLSENAQPAVVVMSYILFRFFVAETGITPYCAVGHSLGEISALISAGALSFCDGLVYVRNRGRIMHAAIQEKRGRAAVVTDIDFQLLAQIVDSIKPIEYIAISGYNSPKQFVVVGTKSALLSLEKKIDDGKRGEFIPFSMIPMKADAPYHSNLMAFVAPELDGVLRELSFKKTDFDVWSTVTGKVIKPEDDIKSILSKQLISPVLWNQVLGQICDCGVDLLIDMGPHQIMKNLAKENVRLSPSLAFDDEHDRQQILECVL